MPSREFKEKLVKAIITNNFSSLKCDAAFKCDNADGLHCHRCPNCDSIWQHPTPKHEEDGQIETISVYTVDTTGTVFTGNPHSCPKCGTETYWKLFVGEFDEKDIDYPWKGEIPNVK